MKTLGIILFNVNVSHSCDKFSKGKDSITIKTSFVVVEAKKMLEKDSYLQQDQIKFYTCDPLNTNAKS